MSVLLIYPPFTHPRFPQLALATLGAHLQRAGFPAAAWDANRAFFRFLLTPARLAQGLTQVTARLTELDGRASLTLDESREYLSWATLLQSLPAGPLDWDALRRMTDKQSREEAFRLAVALASAPHRPETLSVTAGVGAVSYQAPCSNYSTQALLAAAARPGLLAGFCEETLPGVLAAGRPDLAGISVAVEEQILPALTCARALKALVPGVRVVLGGSFVSTAMRRVENPAFFNLVDGLAVDDGEEPLVELARQAPEGRWQPERVAGLSFLAGGRVRHNPPPSPQNLESLAVPDFGLFDLDAYLSPRSEMALPFRSSRGCYWAKCAFCRTGSPIVCHYQQAGPEFLHQSLTALAADTGVTSFAFTDEASAPAALERLCRLLLDKGPQITWGTCFRFERALTPERLSLFHQAGCLSINFGLESYHDRLLALIQKGTNRELIDQVLAAAAAAGLATWAYMMVGLPTESEQEAWTGYRALQDLQARGLLTGFGYSPFQLYPDSLLFTARHRYGVNGLTIPPDQDLLGPLLEFQTPGMSREQALRLATRFNQGEPPRFSPTVRLHGKRVHLRHDLARLFRQVHF
ncbi:MAG: radical SAM protein [Deltaproteobacteria bacterium]|nr:radical SAM protein [Deltaproteobacteria bacterium]